MPTSLPSRPLALGAAIAVAAAALVTLPAVSLTPVPTAIADSPTCVTAIADVPNVHGQVYGPNGTQGFYGVDSEVGVYIAGNWNILNGAAEAEGTIVVGGDATFNSADYFNLGTVGLGSQVNAGAGTDMLTAGGSVAVGTTTTLEVGNHRGGNIRAGGTITPTVPTPKIALNGGTATSGATGVLTPSAAVPTYYQGLSTTLTALPADGTVTSDANTVTFTGTGSSRQVFTVPGSVLGTLASPKSIDFVGIAPNALVVVNVTGTTAAMSSWGYSMNGAPLAYAAAEPDRVFSGWTQSIAWNFPTATSVTLGINGQLPGSVLIPSAGSTLDLRTSINGRLYVNGNVNFGGAGTTGLEIHNYPLRSVCAIETGSFTITKALSDPDAVTLAGREYTGTYECVDSSGDVVAGDDWSLEDGETVTIEDLPVGSECSVIEDALTAAPDAGDATYSWAAPTYSSTGVTVTASAPVGITVSNVVLHDVGSISIQKTVNDADSVVDADRDFTGTWSCVDPAVAVPRPTVASGTWSTKAGSSDTIGGIPNGLSCSIAEDALSTGPSSSDATYSWAAPTYSPASGIVTTGGTVSFTVTNAVNHTVGSLSITKTLTDPDSVVTPGRLFSGSYECSTAGAVVASGTWSTSAGGAAYVVDNIPTPSTCAIAETSLGTAPSADSSYEWVTPTFSPAASVAISTGSTSDVVVANVVRRGLGDLEMIKILDDPFDVVEASRVYTGTWQCTFEALPYESGTWSTTAGAAPLTLATDLPVGTVCTLAEDAATLAAPPLAGFPQYIWRAPVISPATVSILDGVVHRFTVTNTVYDPIGEVSSLAHSGTDSWLPIVIGGGTAAAGILFLWISYRRRRVALRA